MTKYKGVIQYIGTGYAGWQIQAQRPTVQGTLRDAVNRISGETTSIVAAGRTDAGVHALGQVIHFRLQKEFTPLRLLRALNGVLPPDIRVLKLVIVPPDFHAQKHAKKKRYEYRIYNGPVLSPFLNGRVYHVVHPLDYDAMQRACRLFSGSHDFSGFAAASTTVKSRQRTIFLSRLLKKGHRLVYQVEADGFLHHMIRNIMGTLVQIGKGQRPPDDISSILKSRDRRHAGPTAPAHGLYLVRIWY